MNNGQLEDLLDAQSRRLAAGEQDTRWLAGYPEAMLALGPLLLLAREVATVLVPVQPRPAYRAELHEALVAGAGEQALQEAAEISVATAMPPDAAVGELLGRVNQWAGQGWSDLRETDRRWVMGAAALSLLGVIVYVRYQRNRLAA